MQILSQAYQTTANAFSSASNQMGEFNKNYISPSLSRLHQAFTEIRNADFNEKNAEASLHFAKGSLANITATISGFASGVFLVASRLSFVKDIADSKTKFTPLPFGWQTLAAVALAKFSYDTFTVSIDEFEKGSACLNENTAQMIVDNTSQAESQPAILKVVKEK